MVNNFGMVLESEFYFLRSYIAKNFSGKGEIVDLGSWLGTFTSALQLGLEESVKKRKFQKINVHCYDLFRWHSSMNTPVLQGTTLAGKYTDGMSFVDEFFKQVHGPDRCLVYVGDIAQIGWSGRPIEILVNDISKSWSACNAVLRFFYPALIPGKSMVFLHDYFHFYCPWVYLTHYRLRKYFHMETTSLGGDSGGVILYVKKRIPRRLLEKAYDFCDFSQKELAQAFDYASQFAGENESRKANLLAARIMVYVHQHMWEEAAAELDRLKERNLSITHELKLVESFVAQRAF